MNCLLCNTTNVNVFNKDANIFSCNGCGNGFRTGALKKIDYTRHIPMPDMFVSMLLSRHHHDYIEKMVGFRNVNNLLEIGSGDGSLIRYIRNKHKGVKITVIEPGQSFCEELRQIESVTVINDYIENVRIGNKFDLVIMSQVLEHLEAPVRTIEFVRSELLGNSGALYIGVPNRDYELRSVAAAKSAPVQHLFFFDGVGLKEILIKLGFDERLIKGSKYASLPLGYIRRLDKIGRLDGDERALLQLYGQKALNKAWLLLASILRAALAMKFAEISLEGNDYRYNNIAIIAKK